jgi:hypothetical protein
MMRRPILKLNITGPEQSKQVSQKKGEYTIIRGISLILILLKRDCLPIK